MKWRIGEVARLFDLSTDTLRYYEKQGLLAQDKDPVNGYRNYSYDELVILLDVLFLRQMDVAVNDVRKIIKEKELPEIIDILAENKKDIAEKREQLARQQAMLERVIENYQACEAKLGEFRLVAPPSFKFKFIGRHDEDWFSVIERYKKIDVNWMQSIRYAMRIPQDEWSDGIDFALAQLGLSVGAQALSMNGADQSWTLSELNDACYFYTIVATDYQASENQTLQQGMQWLKRQGKTPIGPLVGRYMASCHKRGLDYYEVWIAVK